MAKKTKKILVVDNYDSFVYILVQYLGQLGAEPIVCRNDAENLVETIEQAEPNGILVSPGPGTPDDDGMSVAVIRHFSGGVPILGVCLGHQCIAAAFGGEIKRDKQVTHGKTSEISHNVQGVFDGIANPMTATRYHSLLVDEEGLPEELEITAKTEDGKIMGLQHRTQPTHGIQFHPESILTAEGLKLLDNFLAGCPL